MYTLENVKNNSKKLASFAKINTRERTLCHESRMKVQQLNGNWLDQPSVPPLTWTQDGKREREQKDEDDTHTLISWRCYL